ncbi:hypothetical protein PF005_g10905 [Phytophthora fragariae]|uniref:Uncharacterized protein n=2 Tax=Phytophthora TaxID=4783 RepID=A0A6A3XYW1_9STRA|nr:hypothetical protein PF003_g15832 [Phytophthora fragariae]KAE8999571.1 hypothetical protein PR002_g18416 [Phytophthora rubi]KAE8931131.1 hypothetical protein PF009_g18798 [Phytophthora fragariae]KAE8995884.1 hypothetical protein PF011_g16138 [Phytophthora fragariae]KAE9112531.1 hypothetical protein PF007_g11076 [Phytophthora fragariae]
MPRELRVKAKVNALAGSDSSDKDEPVESSEENQGSWRGPCAAQNAFRILGRPAVLPGSLRTEHAPAVRKPSCAPMRASTRRAASGSGSYISRNGWSVKHRSLVALRLQRA